MPDGGRTPSRLVSRGSLRAYLARMTWEEIKDRMATGRLPRPLWGVSPDDQAARWDLRAVDRALDAASGAPPTLEAAEDMLDRAFGTARA